MLGYASREPGEVGAPAGVPDREQRRLSLALRRAQRVRELIEPAQRAVEAVVIPMPGSGPGEEWRRVEVQVLPLRSQRVAVHEAGHMLGAGDEYVETDPRRIGQPGRHRYGERVDHSGLAEQVWRGGGLGDSEGGSGGHFAPILAGGDADSIMAGGSEVRAHHYVAFVEVLAQLTRTAIGDWEIDAVRR